MIIPSKELLEKVLSVVVEAALLGHEPMASPPPNTRMVSVVTSHRTVNFSTEEYWVRFWCDTGDDPPEGRVWILHCWVKPGGSHPLIDLWNELELSRRSEKRW